MIHARAISSFQVYAFMPQAQLRALEEFIQKLNPADCTGIYRNVYRRPRISMMIA